MWNIISCDVPEYLVKTISEVKKLLISGHTKDKVYQHHFSQLKWNIAKTLGGIWYDDIYNIIFTTLM